jgi:DNA polymerase III subunit delta
MIFILIGDDTALIEHQIKQILTRYQIERYTQYDDLKEAYLNCLSRCLLAKVTATLIQSTQAKFQLDLSSISRLNKSQNLLLIVTPGLDTRTKLGQALKPYIVSNANLPNIWAQKGIKQAISFYAQQLKLNLSPNVVEYLSLALNNNFPLLKSGLESLALLSLNPSLELVREVIPSVHADAFELKQLILQRKRDRIRDYLVKLRAFTSEELILASLATQFRLLMQVAIGIRQNLSDAEVAKLAEVKNVKRLYFLRQEISQISVEQLIWLNQIVKDTQYQLNYNQCDLSARLMLMCCWSDIC